MKTNNSHTHYGFSEIMVITFVFLVLKLEGVLDWSWVQVFTCLIIYLAVVIVAILIFVLFTAIRNK